MPQLIHAALAETAMMRMLLLLLLLLLLPVARSSSFSSPITLDGDTPWVVAAELSHPAEIQDDDLDIIAQGLALRDVELDWYRTTGYRAVIYSNASFDPATQLSAHDSAAVFFGDVTANPWLESTFDLRSHGCDLAAQGPESHCLLTVEGATWQGHTIATAVVAVGHGKRGAIFAAYALSEHVLGVAPMHGFAQGAGAPAWMGGRTLPVPAPAAPLVFPAPLFTHRAIFLNDEELLGFFRRDPLGEAVFDASTLDAILAALLRSKGNAIIVGTTPYPDEKSLRLASRRGVVLTASHFEILGFNAFAWSKAFGGEATKLWDWSLHPDLMMHTWRATVEATRKYEVVWSVGLRGLNDYAYPLCNSSDAYHGGKGCGEIISEAVGNQTEILTEVTNKTADELDFKFNLWTEALGLYQRGELRLPNHTRLVMSDSGAGFIHGDAATFAAADGVYYHTQSKI